MIKTCKNYTINNVPNQLKFPFDFEKLIPDDDSVHLVRNVVEEMDLSSLYGTYERANRKNQVSPKQMLMIVIYASMNRLYSSRDIRKACLRDINFMFLLGGRKVPDHSTIARFISIHLSACSREILSQLTKLLHECGEISGQQIFIDGTKIEANANRYTFVWKKAVLKFQERLFEKICSLVEECEKRYSIRIVYKDKVSRHTLKRLRKELEKLVDEEGVAFVHGKGKRKHQLQKDIELLEEYTKKLSEYSEKLKICGKRNSYSKTDTDATFMRMKDDYMRNGQLKPAYNLQHGVDSEYITWLDIMPNPSDMYTLVPFIKGMEEHLDFKYRNIVADAGYESEENYVFLKKNSQDAYIKPNNYEISKTRKYKSDISIRENMTYNEEKDYYICAQGKKLKPVCTKSTKRRSGYVSEVTVYECNDCKDCSRRSECIKGHNSKISFEDRKKRLNVSKTMKELREECLERLLSDFGTQLRMNRSIQVEGSFGVVKEDMRFNQYLYRGKDKVLAQGIVIALGYNINKLHNKIQTGRTRSYLFELRDSA